MVNEAVKSHKKIKYILGTEEALEEIETQGYEVVFVTKEVFKYLSEEMTPQNVMAILEREIDLGIEPEGNYLVLDRIADPGNMGTIIRSATAFGFKDIYLINCVDPYNGKVVRSSMSGIFFVRLHKVEERSILNYCKGTLIVADMDGESIEDLSIGGQVGLVIGNEANGVSDFLINNCNKVVSIPMNNNIESLNAAVAASIMMFELKN